jgi:hypothetical protein
MSQSHRTTISLDDETQQIIENFDVEVSKELRQHLKDKYHSVDTLERKRDELERKKDRLLEQKQKIEREMQEVHKRLHRINNAITKNDVLRQIRANKEYKKKVNQKVSIIQEAKADSDSDERVQTYIETQAEVLVEQEDLPFEIEQMERVLELLV